MEKFLPVSVAGEDLLCLADKALVWPSRKTLMVADLHWGKAETFQLAGVPVSSSILHHDLDRLAKLMVQHEVQRVIVLGDLIHTARGVSSDVAATVQQWREAYPVPMLLVQGNHDRPLPRTWQIEQVGEAWREEPFLLTHEPSVHPDLFTWSGHLHPCVRLGSRVNRMRLPCFWLQEHTGVLPSFGSFTGGALVQAKARDRILAILEDRIVHLQ